MVNLVGEFERCNMFNRATAEDISKMFPDQHFDLQGRAGPFTVVVAGESRDQEPEVIRIRDEADPKGVFFINPKNPAWTFEVGAAAEAEERAAHEAEVARIKAQFSEMRKHLTARSAKAAEALTA